MTEARRPAPQFLAQSVPEIRSPLFRVREAEYAPNCAQLRWAAEKRNVAEGAKKVGRQFGAAMGNFEATIRMLDGVLQGTLWYQAQKTPEILTEVHAKLAADLDAIPELPAQTDPELATIARQAFEEGYGAEIDQAHKRALAVNTAATALMSFGPGLIQTAGAKALQAALSRLRSMPIFVPGAAGGAGFFFRAPKVTATAPAGATPPSAPPPANVPTTAAGTVKTTTRMKAAPAESPASAPAAGKPKNPGEAPKKGDVAPQVKAASVRKPHQPDPEKWRAKGGTIKEHPDGRTTYRRSDGVEVTYDRDGFPDFSRYKHPEVKDVQIRFTGSRPKDDRLANAAAGLSEKPAGYTWHHHQDRCPQRVLPYRWNGRQVRKGRRIHEDESRKSLRTHICGTDRIV